jgi:hypothetical protein
MPRKKVPKSIQDEILIKSRRRCCICYALQGDCEEKRGQIAHLDGDRANNNPDNLAFLCLDHHDQFDSRTSQSKGFSVSEVKEHRSQLYSYINRTFPSLEDNERVVDEEIVVGELISVNQITIGVHDDIDEIQSRLTITGLANEWGISENEFKQEINKIRSLLGRIEDANLTRNQSEILASIIKNVDYSEIPRRVVESDTGYDYLSNEFFAEMTMLEHRGFVSFTHDMDGLIHLPSGETELWQLICFLCEQAKISVEEIIRKPDLNLILPDNNNAA